MNVLKWIVRLICCWTLLYMSFELSANWFCCICIYLYISLWLFVCFSCAELFEVLMCACVYICPHICKFADIIQTWSGFQKKVAQQRRYLSTYVCMRISLFVALYVCVVFSCVMCVRCICLRYVRVLHLLVWRVCVCVYVVFCCMCPFTWAIQIFYCVHELGRDMCFVLRRRAWPIQGGRPSSCLLVDLW